jgi:hypothetical protein
MASTTSTATTTCCCFISRALCLSLPHWWWWIGDDEEAQARHFYSRVCLAGVAAHHARHVWWMAQAAASCKLSNLFSGALQLGVLTDASLCLLQ